jgi:diazepam-binding inhibitor (GABA receptor modulating acyl-CoA-binding protein)
MSDTTDLQARFDRAVAASKGLPAQSPAGLLELYGLFKQASAGDVTGARPGMLDMRGRAKFDAWAKHKGMPKADAMAAYIAVVERLGGAPV